MAVAAEVGYTARPLCHAHHMRHSSRARAPRHHRASSTFPFRALPRARSARARCGGGGARSLALSRARCGGDGGGGGGGGGRLRRASIVSRASRCSCTTHTHAASSPRVARVIAVSRPPHDRHARCGGGGARSLSIARAVWRWRWRWVTPCVMRVCVTHIHITRFVCHARARARHHRVSCASSTCPFRPRAIGTRVLRLRRRSLARSIVRTRCGVGDGDGGSGAGGGRLHRVPRAMYVTRARARVITAHGARHQRFPSPRDRHACAAVWCRRSLARSITRTRCVAVAMAVAVEVG